MLPLSKTKKIAILQKVLENIKEFINSKITVCNTRPIPSLTVNKSYIVKFVTTANTQFEKVVLVHL